MAAGFRRRLFCFLIYRKQKGIWVLPAPQAQLALLCHTWSSVLWACVSFCLRQVSPNSRQHDGGGITCLCCHGAQQVEVAREETLKRQPALTLNHPGHRTRTQTDLSRRESTEHLGARLQEPTGLRPCWGPHPITAFPALISSSGLIHGESSPTTKARICLSSYQAVTLVGMNTRPGPQGPFHLLLILLLGSFPLPLLTLLVPLYFLSSSSRVVGQHAAQSTGFQKVCSRVWPSLTCLIFSHPHLCFAFPSLHQQPGRHRHPGLVYRAHVCYRTPCSDPAHCLLHQEESRGQVPR